MDRDPGKKLRVGVVGIGHLGSYHLQKYHALPDCEIVGVVDVLQERACRAAKTFQCRAFRHPRDLLGLVDAVSVAVPTEAHHQVARDLLAGGIDVLLEKPMARTLAEADDLIRVAEAQKRILQIGMIERFNPAIVALQTLHIRPLFIETHRLHPFMPRGTDVDVILDLMIHDLDILCAVAASPVEQIDAVGVPVLSDKVDIANVRLRFASGCVANVTASRISLKTLQKVRFFGVEGYHAVDYSKRTLLSLRRDRDPDGRVVIAENPVAVQPQDPLEAEIRAFLSAVAQRKAPPVTAEDGRACLALALRILAAMETVHEAPRP